MFFTRFFALDFQNSGLVAWSMGAGNNEPAISNVPKFNTGRISVNFAKELILAMGILALLAACAFPLHIERTLTCLVEPWNCTMLRRQTAAVAKWLLFIPGPVLVGVGSLSHAASDIVV